MRVSVVYYTARVKKLEYSRFLFLFDKFVLPTILIVSDSLLSLCSFLSAKTGRHWCRQLNFNKVTLQRVPANDQKAGIMEYHLCRARCENGEDSQNVFNESVVLASTRLRYLAVQVLVLVMERSSIDNHLEFIEDIKRIE